MKKWFGTLLGLAIFLVVMLFIDGTLTRLTVAVFAAVGIAQLAIYNSRMADADAENAKAVLIRVPVGLVGLTMIVAAMTIDDITVTVLGRLVGAAFGALLVYAAVRDTLEDRVTRIALQEADDKLVRKRIIDLEKRIDNLEL